MEMAMEAWGLQAGDLEWVTQALSSMPCEEDLAPYLLLTGQQQGIGDAGGGGGVSTDQLISSKRPRTDTEGARAGGRPGKGTHKRNRSWERPSSTTVPPFCIPVPSTSHQGDDDVFDQDVEDDKMEEKQASSKRQRGVDVATQKRMERKKTREKMRRIEVNDGFTELMEALAEVDEPEDPTQPKIDASAKAAETAKGAIKLLGDKGHFRVELLTRAVKALRRLSDAAKADRARVERLRGKLKALGEHDDEEDGDDDSGDEESAEVKAQRSAATETLNTSSVEPEAQAGSALLRTRLPISRPSLSPPPTTKTDPNTENSVANVNMPREAGVWFGLSAQGSHTLTHAHAHANRAAEVDSPGGLSPPPNTSLGSMTWMMTNGEGPLWTLPVSGGGGGDSGVSVCEDVAVPGVAQRTRTIHTQAGGFASSSSSTRVATVLQQPLPTPAGDLSMAKHMQQLQQQHQQSHLHQHRHRQQPQQQQQQPLPVPQPWMMGYLLSPFELPPRASMSGINACALLPTATTSTTAPRATTTTPTLTDPLHLLPPFALPLPPSSTPLLPYHPLATDLTFPPIDGVFSPPRTLTDCVHGEPTGVGGMVMNGGVQPASVCAHGGADGCDDCVYDAQMHVLPWLMQGYCEGLEMEVPTHAPCA